VAAPKILPRDSCSCSGGIKEAGFAGVSLRRRLGGKGGRGSLYLFLKNIGIFIEAARVLFE
jgi:hypothetical protein